MLVGMAPDAHAVEPLGSGPIAAEVAALAARLIATLARRSAGCWPDAGRAAAEATDLAERLDSLGRADAHAYLAALEALRGTEHSGEALREKLSAAADIPIQICEAASEIALLAREVVDRGEPELEADACGAAMMAEGAARAAAQLVSTNLTITDDDPRVVETATLVSRAEAAVREAARGR
jgi:formiminotetrahydrofolate cyclodeaminase